MPLPLLPDPLALTIDAIKGQPSVTALTAGPYPGVPNTPTWPLLVVSVVDAHEGYDPSVLTARMQVDVWGAGNSPANLAQVWDVARALYAAARDLRGEWRSGAISNSAWLTTTPVPDPDSGRHRLAMDLQIDAHPTNAASGG